MRNKLVNIVEEINHKINKTVVEEEQGQASFILQLIDEMLPHSVASVMYDVLGRDFTYKGTMMSHMDGNALIFRLENATMMEYVHLKIEFQPSRNNYCVKIIHDYMAGTINATYKLFEAYDLEEEQLQTLSTLIDDNKHHMKALHQNMLKDKQLRCKSMTASNEIINQTYEDKLRKLDTDQVHGGGCM